MEDCPKVGIRVVVKLHIHILDFLNFKNMKKYSLIGWMVCCALGVQAQSPAFNWVHQTGASNAVTNMDVEKDAAGNSYVTGFFSGTIDLDPGVGQQQVSTNGSSDIYLAKYDASGQLIWGRAFGSSGADEGLHIDVLGNSVISCGFFLTSVTFDSLNPNGFLNSFGDFDAYITKYDTAGNFIWAKQVGGFAGIEEARSVCQDALGNVYVTGFFTGQADMDPSNASLLIPSAGGQDVWVMKLDANGNLVWVKTFGGTSADQANEIVIDQQGNVVVAGSFRMTADLDPGAGTVSVTSAGFDDAYVVRFDSSGQYQWSATFGNTGSDIANTVDVDANGNIILAGFFQNSIDADPGPGTALLTTTGNVGGYVIKINSSGAFVFGDVLNGTNNNSPRQLKVHSNGHILVAGSFNGTCDFDPTAGLNNITSAGSDDAYLLRLDAGGNVDWVVTYGGGAFEDAHGIAIDTSQNILVTGRFSGATDFDPGAGSVILTPANSRDGYVLSLQDPVVTALSEISTLNQLTVSPNPAQTMITVETGVCSDCRLNLVDNTGRLVHNFPVVNEKTFISVAELPAGFYILSLIRDTEIRSVKLTVVR
jgi:hypothetical protein